MNINNHGKTKQNKDQPSKWLDYPSHQDDPGHLSIWLINDYNINCKKTLNLYSSCMNIINHGKTKQNKDQPQKWLDYPSHQDDPGQLSIWLINDYNIYCKKTLNLY